MKKNKGRSTDPDGLRRRAKEKLKGKTTDTRIPFSEEDSQRILHELQTYQIELKLHNEDLRKANEKIEEGLQRYSPSTIQRRWAT